MVSEMASRISVMETSSGTVEVRDRLPEDALRL